MAEHLCPVCDELAVVAGICEQQTLARPDGPVKSAWRAAAAVARERAARHQGAAETVVPVSQDPQPVSGALRAATEAVRGCNVRWATAIDDPEIVARVALAAAEPLIRAEAIQSFAVNAQALTREAVDREQERRARAVDLLSRALSLRTAEGYPGVSTEWGKWDRDCEAYLRSLAPGE